MKNRWRRLVRGEDGLEALQVVMIVAIAAVCIVLIKTYWTDISDLVKEALDIVQE